MLNRLVFNAGGEAPFPLVVADATRLPFEDGSFEFVLACHVHHLIAQWQTVAAEVMRVLSPTGTLLVDFGGGAPSPWTKPARKVLHRHGIEHLRPGVSEPDALVNELHQLVSVRRLRPVEMVEHRSVAGDVFEWERQIQSWTWPYSPAQMKKACTAVRDWATRAGWSLEREIEVRRTIQWWAFDRIPR
jgi:SAM-dependent methyltransferase